MKRYPVYKDSGVEGLGEIPEHWDLKRLASFGTFSKGSTISKSDLVENGLPVILYGDIYTKYNLRAETIFHFISQDLAANSKQIYKGDLLFTGSGETREDIGKCIVYNGNGKVYAGGDIIIFRQKTNDSLFLAYFFSSNYAIAKKAMNSRGDIVVHIYASSLRAIYIPIPPLSEQKAIAHFINRKLEQIEQFIRNKKRLIELLNEQKTAIINRAVTKGINRHAPMKDSGIGWLGEIPAHWEAKLFRRVTTRIEVGIAEAATHAYTDEGIPIIRSTNVKTHFIELDNILHIQKWFADKNCSKYIYTGDILTVRTGANAGMTSVVPKELNHSQCFTLLISTPSPQHLPQFYSFYINSPMGQEFFSIEGWGAAQVNLSVPILQNLPVVEPPYEEQKAIVYFIEKESAKVDLAIAQVEKEIELIQEYRTTLISDAVTGKIDVRPNSLIETTLTA